MEKDQSELSLDKYDLALPIPFVMQSNRRADGKCLFQNFSYFVKAWGRFFQSAVFLTVTYNLTLFERPASGLPKIAVSPLMNIHMHLPRLRVLPEDIVLVVEDEEKVQSSFLVSW